MPLPLSIAMIQCFAGTGQWSDSIAITTRFLVTMNKKDHLCLLRWTSRDIESSSTQSSANISTMITVYANESEKLWASRSSGSLQWDRLGFLRVKVCGLTGSAHSHNVSAH